jgi:hypothetical protein
VGSSPSPILHHHIPTRPCLHPASGYRVPAGYGPRTRYRNTEADICAPTNPAATTGTTTQAMMRFDAKGAEAGWSTERGQKLVPVSAPRSRSSADAAHNFEVLMRRGRRQKRGPRRNLSRCRLAPVVRHVGLGRVLITAQCSAGGGDPDRRDGGEWRGSQRVHARHVESTTPCPATVPPRRSYHYQHPLCSAKDDAACVSANFRELHGEQSFSLRGADPKNHRGHV